MRQKLILWILLSRSSSRSKMIFPQHDSFALVVSWTNKTYTHEIPSSSPVSAFDGETTLDSFFLPFQLGCIKHQKIYDTCLLISPLFLLSSILCVSYVALFNCAVVFAKRLSLCLRGWICCCSLAPTLISNKMNHSWSSRSERIQLWKETLWAKVRMFTLNVILKQILGFTASHGDTM